VQGDIWNATIFEGGSEFDSFSFHPYRFYRSDPEADCCGQCGQTFREQMLMANADLKQAGHKQAAVFLTEEAQGVTLQRTRCIGSGLGAGFNYIMRLQSWSQGEIIYANFVARMYVTAIGERGVGYSNHAGTRLFAADDIFTPNLLAATVHTMSVQAGLRQSRSLGRLAAVDQAGYEGYLFLCQTGGLVVAMWTRDGQFAAPQNLTLGSIPCASSAETTTLFNTWGNRVAVVEPSSTTLFELGRDVVYLKLPGCSVGDEHVVRAAISKMLSAKSAASALPGWPLPFKTDDAVVKPDKTGVYAPAIIPQRRPMDARWNDGLPRLCSIGVPYSVTWETVTRGKHLT
jgi:hypothetical protein